MPVKQPYDRLLQLPFFLGMSRNEVTELMGYTKLGFYKVDGGCSIVKEHDGCDKLVFLLDGQMEVIKSSDRHDYKICEYIHAPALIEPERLFGLYPFFTRSYSAHTACQLMTISKPDVLAICQAHNIFFINLLGQLSTVAQKLSAKPWHDVTEEKESRVISFLAERMLTLRGKKTVEIKMQTLATAVRESRLNVSRMLNRWHDLGLIVLGRERIQIPAFERLLERGK